MTERDGLGSNKETCSGSDRERESLERLLSSCLDRQAHTKTERQVQGHVDGKVLAQLQQGDRFERRHTGFDSAREVSLDDWEVQTNLASWFFFCSNGFDV